VPAKDAKQPLIVIKRIKKGHHGHHGGAWKIAYADFVTAMMAFFLLMWLLGSTSQGDLKGIQDYFANPVKVSMLGGRGAGDSSSLIQGGGTDLTRRDGQVKNGDYKPTNDPAAMLRAAKIEAAKQESQRLQSMKRKVEESLAANPKLKEHLNQVKLDMTPDGLRIQIVDDQNRPMFDLGSALVKDYMRDLLREIGGMLNEMDARITLSGHTDAKPFSAGGRGYSNWELSADRANASRRELVAGGMDEAKIFRVMGLAASVPLDASDVMASTNRRISIIVMNKRAETRLMKGGGTVDASDSDDVRDVLEEGGIKLKPNGERIAEATGATSAAAAAPVVPAALTAIAGGSPAQMAAR
jgi:chemotaxis protein MotB